MKSSKIGFKTIIWCGLFVLSISFFMFYLMRIIEAISFQYPGEIRGAANILWADAISKGIDVYDLGNSPELFVKYSTVYSGISLVLCGLITRLLNTDIVRTIYWFQVVALLFTAVVVLIAIAKKMRSKRFLAIPILAGINVLTVFLYASGKPGQLAVLLVSIAVLLCDYDIFPWLQALLMVAAFWDKQYFVVCAVPILVKYILDKHWKSVMVYSATGFISGGVSACFVMKKYPLYFVETFLSRSFDEGISKYTKMYHWTYSYNQMKAIMLQFWLFAVLSLVGIVICCFRKTIDVYSIYIVLMIVFLAYFGQGTGNYLVYHYELLVPELVIFGTRVLLLGIDKAGNCKGLTQRGFSIVLAILLITNCIYVFNSRNQIKVLNEEEVRTYEELYAYIDTFSGKIFLGASVALYSIYNDGDFTISNGLSGYFVGMKNGGINRGQKKENGLVHRVIPLVDDMIEKSCEYWEQQKYQIENKEYSLLVLISNIDEGIAYSRGELGNYYHVVDSFNIVNSAGQKWEVKCWIPN